MTLTLVTRNPVGTIKPGVGDSKLRKNPVADAVANVGEVLTYSPPQCPYTHSRLSPFVFLSSLVAAPDPFCHPYTAHCLPVLAWRNPYG